MSSPCYTEFMSRPLPRFSKDKKKGRHIQLLSGRIHPQLARDIAKSMKMDLTEVDISDFANGEVRVQIKDSMRGNDVFIIQAHSGSVNRSIMEQLLMIDAAKRGSARSITAVCPFFGYARQDRKSRSREPIGARLIVDLLSVAGADRIMSVDLHSGQTQGFFDGPFDHLIAMPLFKRYLRDNIDLKKLVMVSPDAGRVKMAERYSTALGCELAIIHKHRPTGSDGNKPEARYLIGDVQDKICVTVDDMIDTAGTIATAADLLLSRGAKEIYSLATHGVFSGPALERLEKSSFTKIITTDTLPTAISGAKSIGKIETLSIAPLIADAISAIAADESVSALFEGQNQA